MLRVEGRTVEAIVQNFELDCTCATAIITLVQALRQKRKLIQQKKKLLLIISFRIYLLLLTLHQNWGLFKAMTNDVVNPVNMYELQ